MLVPIAAGLYSGDGGSQPAGAKTARHPKISRPCRSRRGALVSGGRLRGEVVPRASLAPGLVRELFALFARHYEHVDWPHFAADLAEKDCAILLRDARSGEVRGFSTQKVLRATVGGRAVRAIFSGDTIIDPAFWGDQELVRGWCRFAGTVRAAEPGVPLFWFLISKGYRTYLYLPLFFVRYHPNPAGPTPAREQAIMDALAAEKFPGAYRAATGTLEFPDRRGNLTPDLASIPAARLRDPRVQFFLARNPDHARGTELVCLAEIAPENMRSIAARALAGAECAAAGQDRAPRQCDAVAVARATA
jgi:hypothetical protein